MAQDHLAAAKEFLAVAESGDARREAYIRAAMHLSAYREENPRGYRQKAASYCNTSVHTVDKLVKWRDSGFAADTPFLMDEQATSRAALSHTKRVLREGTPEQVAELVGEALQRDDVIEHLADDPVKAERVIHHAGEAVVTKTAEKHGLDASRAQRVSETAEGGGGILGALGELRLENQILIHLEKAAHMAIDADAARDDDKWKDFYVEMAEEAISKVKMAKLSSDPDGAIADLEKWLADQSQPTT